MKKVIALGLTFILITGLCTSAFPVEMVQAAEVSEAAQEVAQENLEMEKQLELENEEQVEEEFIFITEDDLVEEQRALGKREAANGEAADKSAADADAGEAFSDGATGAETEEDTQAEETSDFSDGDADVVSNDLADAVDIIPAAMEATAAADQTGTAVSSGNQLDFPVPDTLSDAEGQEEVTGTLETQNSLKSRDASIQDTSIQDTSIQDTSIQDTSIQDTSVQDASAQDVSSQDTFVQDASAQDASIQDTSIPDASAQDASIQDTSIPDAAVPDTSIPDPSVQTPAADSQEVEVFEEAPDDEVTVYAEQEPDPDSEEEEEFGGLGRLPAAAADISARLSDRRSVTPGTDGREYVLKVEDGADITARLNSVLLEAGEKATDEEPCKVIIPPGSYELTGTICTYSNIYLYAVGATITKVSKEKHILLRLGNDQTSAGGYSGYRNVTIEGGTWDCNYSCCEKKEEEGGFVGFRIGHVTNVVIKDATFLNNLKSHFLEFGGVKNAKVTGCTFSGYWKPYEKGGQECIQIDVCQERIFPGYLPYDGSVCEDIIIEGNLFKNVFAGVGSHSMMFNKPYKNITITNNTFKNIKKRAVWCLNYQNSEVSQNVMKNVGGGIYVRSVYSKNTHLTGTSASNSQNQDSEALVIKNNTIAIGKSGTIAGAFWRTFGIVVLGENCTGSTTGVPTGKYIIKGVTVKGNAISGPGNGIHLELADRCKVSGNTIKLQKTDQYENFGIYLGASRSNRVLENTVEQARNSGIYVYSSTCNRGSSKNVISGNKVSGCGAEGIYIDTNSNKSTIEENVTSDNRGNGIRLNSSEITMLKSNESYDNKKNGIYAYGCNIVAQGYNIIRGNRSSYAIYLKNCRGKSQSLKKVAIKTITSKTKYASGSVAGGKSVLVKLAKSGEKLASGSVNSKGIYKIAIQKQKTKTLLMVTVTDKYKNKVLRYHRVS